MKPAKRPASAVPVKMTSILSLFASSSTLICCALPILLTTLGLGSALFSLVEGLPFLSTLTANKNHLFVLVLVLLGLNYWWVFHPNRRLRLFGFGQKNAPASGCEVSPDDPKRLSPCDAGNHFARRMFKISLVIYCIGLFFAYLLLPIYRLWEP